MKNIRFAAPTAALAFLMAGCVAPDAERPDLAADLPPEFLAGAPEGEVEGSWWRRFGDAELTRLIETELSDNPSILQALARVEQARAQARVTEADLLPQANLGLTAARQRQNLSGLGGIGELLGNAGGDPTQPSEGGDDETTSFVTDNYQLSLDVQWQVDLFGRIRSQSAAARAEYLASAENLRAVRQTIAAETARLYFNLVEARAQTHLSERVVDTFGEISRQVGNRADVGIAPPNDKLLAIANLGSAKAGLEQRRQGVETLGRQLDILARDYPDGDVTTAAALPEVPPPPPAGLPAELLLRRPDVRAAEHAMLAAGFRVTAAKRSFLPSIALTGSGGTTSSELGNLLDGDFLVWSIAGQLLQPVFQGGRLRAQLAAAEGARDEAVEAYAEVVLQALFEVETALAVEDELRRREEALAAASEAAEAAVDVSFNRYRAGIDPFLTVLESQQRALDARSAFLAARNARLANRIDLHLALGGGFGVPSGDLRE
ncbi:hypothetical protein B5C34_15640 [Pacificimonas flava]|uniref:RND efflux system, outer membrane lipoprotein CmeC n=2 Tax=Pacificimonas TaxID=1960290 RepID=A0A219B1D0_9SPHN|nr:MULTISPECIES: efflux transporter outer membrane subunit [Pacificimonas]MBZ6379602.1 efflux transporter outer membrane subunit [Pacificimonas aurantium]OWV31926.1 hypothetical protein B5C34_15640 [Pacificimonas flava]